MKIKRPLCIAGLIFVVLVIAFTKGRPPRISDEVKALDGKTVCIIGKIMDRQIKNGTMQVYIKNISHNEIEGLVLYLDNYSQYENIISLGRIVKVRGVFSCFLPPDNEGQFNQETYYKIKGFDGTLKRGRIEEASADYNAYGEMLRKCREEVAAVFDEYLDEQDSGILNAMVLGDKSELETDIKEKYQNAGVSHLLALSGLHIAAVGLALLKFLRKIGLNIILSSIISGIIISCYAYMTGFSISTRRALIMFLLGVIALCLGRTYDLITGAAVSSGIILISNPYYIYDSGFLLSFLAVVGIGIVLPVVNLIIPVDRIRNSKNFFINKGKSIASSLLASLSITISTLPVTAYSFFQIPVYSIFLNLIVIPLMSIILFTGFLGGIIGLTCEKLLKDAGFIKILPSVIFGVTHGILWLYEKLCDLTGRISGNIFVIGRPGKIQIIIYSVILVGIMLAILWRDYRNTNRNNSLHNSRRSTGRTRITNHRNMSVYIILIIGAFTILSYHPREDVEIRNISVGQGDGALIFIKNGPVLMIDGGSSDVKDVGKYRIIPVLKSNGIAKVDLCILSHLDADHISGVLDILDEQQNVVTIDKIVMSKASFDEYVSSSETPENFTKLMDGVKTKNVELLLMSKGDIIELDNVILTCLAPANEKVYGEFDANEQSLVVSMQIFNDASVKNKAMQLNDKECIFSALFTGDIGETSELNLHLPDTNYTYLKVAHHGSRFSSSEYFLNKVKPKMSVISVGKDNSYNHPHAETLERLEDTGTRIFRTDEIGEVITKITDNGVFVETIK